MTFTIGELLIICSIWGLINWFLGRLSMYLQLSKD